MKLNNSKAKPKNSKLKNRLLASGFAMVMALPSLLGVVTPSVHAQETVGQWTEKKRY